MYKKTLHTTVYVKNKTNNKDFNADNLVASQSRLMVVSHEGKANHQKQNTQRTTVCLLHE